MAVIGLLQLKAGKVHKLGRAGSGIDRVEVARHIGDVKMKLLMAWMCPNYQKEPYGKAITGYATCGTHKYQS